MMALEHVGGALARFAVMNFAGIPMLTLLHAISTSWSFRRSLGKTFVSPLEALVATFILAFGGSTMTVLSIVYKGGSFLKTAVILGQSWAWIQGMYNVPVYVLVVMAMHYMPRDLLFKALESIAVVAEPVMIVSEAASQALAISSMGVDAVRMHLSSRAGGDGIMYAAIICGTIAGCGGSIIANMLGVESGSWSVRTPAQLKSPTCKVIAPFVGAIVYFGLTDRMHLRAMWPKFLGAAPAFPLMGPAAAMGALMVILMSHKMMGVMEPMMKSLTTLMSSSSASRSPAKRSQSPAPRKKKMAK